MCHGVTGRAVEKGRVRWCVRLEQDESGAFHILHDTTDTGHQPAGDGEVPGLDKGVTAPALYFTSKEVERG